MKRIYLLGILLTMVACKKENVSDNLPQLTQEGKNIGGCKIDGEIWRTSGTNSPSFSSLGTAAIVSKKKGQSVYNISIILSGGESSRTIALKCINTPGYGLCEFNTASPPVTSPETSHTLYHNGSAPGAVGDFVTGPTATGWLEITYLDTQKQIVAGRFAFTGQDLVTGRKVIVTEGRFDTICYYLELP